MIFEEGAISWQVKGHVLQLDGQQMGQGPFLRVAGGVGTTSICRPPSRLLPVGPSSSVAATSISFLPPHAGAAAAAALAAACIYFSLSVWNWPISTLVCARATKGALFATGLAQHDHMY